MLRHIKDSKSYLEFGSGGSTFLALLHTDSKITSVESSKEWISYLKEYRVIREAESRLEFIFADIGRVGEWGYPLDKSAKESFPLYSSSAFMRDKSYDCIFIDGRFRVACALQSILNCPNAKILIHDFNDREEYHCILEFVEIIDTQDTMALFKLRDNASQSAMLELYERYKYIAK